MSFERREEEKMGRIVWVWVVVVSFCGLVMAEQKDHSFGLWSFFFLFFFILFSSCFSFLFFSFLFFSCSSFEFFFFFQEPLKIYLSMPGSHSQRMKEKKSL